jgi:hypothetical protein
MRRVFIATLMVSAVLPTQAAMAQADRPVLRLSTVGQFGTTPYPSSAIVSDVLRTGAPAGQPFYARTAGPGSVERDSALSSLAFSSEPFQVSMDPRRDAPYRMVYSRCAGSGAMGSCALFAQVRGGQEVNPTTVTPAAVGTRDRLPSTYGSAVAFARSRFANDVTELRYVASLGGPSREIPGGPTGTGTAQPLGIAMHGRTIAYVWAWRTKSGNRTSLRLYRPHGESQTLATLSSGRGRIIGPSWQKGRVVFGVRRNGLSTLYRYDPSTRQFASARGPRNLAAIAGTDRYLYWQTAPARSLRSGLCPASDCALWLDQPSFRRAARPQ